MPVSVGAARVARLMSPLASRCLGIATLLVLTSTNSLVAQAADSLPPRFAREFRGAWVASVANIDWPSRPGLSSFEQQSEMIAILDRARALNLNAVLLQVRPAADALYASKLEPWSEYLTGLEGRAPEPYYDPLTFAVEAAHERGLELHAWFNPYRSRHPSAKSPPARTHISETHPSLVRTYGRYGWMDPGEPAVLQRTVRVILDVVQRYDIDGIHIDDYFYPYPDVDSAGAEVPFPDSSSYTAYRKRGGRLERNDWRRHNVDTLVQLLYKGTKRLKPWVKVGISPFGIWRPGFPAQIKGFDSYDKLYGDSRLWLREGWIDYFTPQLYWPIAQTAQSYPVLLDWWLGENTKRRHIWPGHNASRASSGGAWSPDELNAQVRATRATAATGDVHFSMRALMPVSAVRRDSVLVGVATQPPAQANAAALADRLRSELYAEPALIPASPWLSTRAPKAPVASLGVELATGEPVVRLTPIRGEAVRWWTVQALVDGQWRRWLLPAAQRQVVIGSAGSTPAARVVVSAVDRFGTESAFRILRAGPR